MFAGEMNLTDDSFKHKGLRKILVDTIKEKGITDENVIVALLKVPRHLFFDSAFVEKAYEDKAFPIGEGQTISQPFTVAYQSSLLNIKRGDKILEIGTGSGYQGAILYEMGAKIFTIERQKKLYDRAKFILKELGYEAIKVFFGDGFEGLPTFAPFDKILVTAGADEIPHKLLAQLKTGGVMVIPVGKEVQKMQRITRNADNTYSTEEFGNFKFVPFLHGKVNL
jgi:protein-L-isoaspartate(D-aspartate) O-methyltransferase